MSRPACDTRVNVAPVSGAIYATPTGRLCRMVAQADVGESQRAFCTMEYLPQPGGARLPLDQFTLSARNYWLLRRLG